MKAFSAEPGNRDIGQTKVGGNQQWVVSAPMKPDRDRIWLCYPRLRLDPLIAVNRTHFSVVGTIESAPVFEPTSHD